ncbi:MAG: phage baseplate assembly protein V, partial [Cyanobacteriota bacterium]
MSFDQLVRPTFAEARCTSLQEGFLFGLIPGIVTRVDDPERIGRVQVECSVIEAGVNLPNSNDGWIPVMESFVVNGSTGGSHSFVQVGSQVLMSCLFGDPRQMVVVGSLPSRVDRPHPDLNRAESTYGCATPNETIEAFRDTDASAVISRPNGVLQTISGEGDVMTQTEERGRVLVQRDGTTSLSNDLSHTTLSKDGEVSQRSAKGAESILRANGDVDITSSSASSLRLRKAESTLEGPLNPLSSAIAQISELSGVLGETQGLLTDLQAIAQDFGVGGDVEGFLGNAQSVLDDLQNLTSSLEAGAAALEKLQDFSVEDLGKSLLPQVRKFLELGDLPQQIEPLLQNGLAGEVIAQQVLEILPDNIAKNFSVQQIGSILEGLRHDPAMQFQAVLGAIAPDSFASIRNIIGLELHPSMRAIAQVIQAYQATPSENFMPDPLPPAIAALRRQLPSTIQQFLSDEVVASALRQPDLDTALTTLLGTSLAGLASETIDRVNQIRGIAKTLEPLRQTAAELESGQPTDETPAQLQSSIFEQVQAIAPNITNSLQSINQLSNAV